MEAKPVEVWRGRFGDPIPVFGPLPGKRHGNVVAYEFGLPERFVPWPTTTRLQRTYILLDVGVGLSLPTWHHVQSSDGPQLAGLDPDGDAPSTWYIDLLHVADEGDKVISRDLYIDVMVPVDGRPYRILDLDEFGDAIDGGVVPTDVAVNGLRRWQTFLDRYLHSGDGPAVGWSDFPPKEFAPLVALTDPLGPIVTWSG